MQQVQYLSWVNSRRNVWPPLGKLITNQTKTNWYPAWNHRQGFIYQRMAQKLHCDPQFDCDSAFFLSSTKWVIPWTSRNTQDERLWQQSQYMLENTSDSLQIYLSLIPMAEATNCFNILPNSPNKQILHHHKLCQTGPKPNTGCKILCWRIHISSTNIVMEKQGRKKTTEVIAESAYEFLSLGRGWFLKQLGCTDWKRFKIF